MSHHWQETANKKPSVTTGKQAQQTLRIQTTSPSIYSLLAFSRKVSCFCFCFISPENAFKMTNFLWNQRNGYDFIQSNIKHLTDHTSWIASAFTRLALPQSALTPTESQCSHWLCQDYADNMNTNKHTACQTEDTHARPRTNTQNWN